MLFYTVVAGKRFEYIFKLGIHKMWLFWGFFQLLWCQQEERHCAESVYGFHLSICYYPATHLEDELR